MLGKNKWCSCERKVPLELLWVCLRVPTVRGKSRARLQVGCKPVTPPPVHLKLLDLGFGHCKAPVFVSWVICWDSGNPFPLHAGHTAPFNPGPQRSGGTFLSLNAVLASLQAAHQGRSRQAKGMKDVSTAQLTAGRLQKGPLIVCAETAITVQTPTLSTCLAPVSDLQARGGMGWYRHRKEGYK